MDPNVIVTNLDIGPQIVEYDGVDLGGTLDNVLVKIAYKKSPLKADQFGDSELDKAVSAVAITVETSIAEVRDKDKWKVAFPNADEVTVGAQKYIQFNNKIAVRDLPQSKILRLKPIVESSSVKDFDHYFYKALSNEESELTLAFQNQYKLKIIWTIFPDMSVTPARWYRHGDFSI